MAVQSLARRPTRLDPGLFMRLVPSPRSLGLSPRSSCRKVAIHWTSRSYGGSSLTQSSLLQRSKRDLYGPMTQTRSASNFQVSREVQSALASNQPVVALETTIYTHGYEYPRNLALSKDLEALVRDNGAVPATIGILEGVAHVGMSESMLQRLVETEGVDKVSRRDLAFTLGLSKASRPLSGGTTIAGTMILAEMAGIKVFATGGLGGVHRGGEASMDISADLTELGRTQVTVISSGCKGFLDIARTVEFLETQGVAVATFADGRAGPVEMPAFWSRDSGVKSPRVLGDESEAAAVIYAQDRLGLKSGLFFANPVPEDFSIPRAELEDFIEQAITAAHEAGATGSANTPYILTKLHELTAGRSAKANTALVRSNVVRGAKVAAELCKLQSSDSSVSRQSVAMPKATVIVERAAEKSQSDHLEAANQVSATIFGGPTAVDIVVAGSVAIDSACDFRPIASSEISPQQWTSNPATINQTIGGVGHNIARAAQLTGAKVSLVSAVADDLPGTAALAGLQAEGLDTSFIGMSDQALGNKTAQYIAVNNSRSELHLAMADMSLFDDTVDIERLLEPLRRSEVRPSWLAIDANWGTRSLEQLLRFALELPDAKVVYEPVSTAKSIRLFSTKALRDLLSVHPTSLVELTTPNSFELAAMHKALYDAGAFEIPQWWHTIDAIGMPSTGMRNEFMRATSPALVDAGTPQQSIQLLPFLPTIVTTLGEEGVLLTMLLRKTDPRLCSPAAAPYILSRSQQDGSEVGGVYMRLFPPAKVLNPDSIISVNGAGDTFTGTLLSSMAQAGDDALIEDMIPLAQEASILTLGSQKAVADELTTLAVKLKKHGLAER